MAEAERIVATILGCGSSGGVPRIGNIWGACDPANPRNRRTRCSMLVRRKGAGEPEDWTTALVDTSPDLVRQTSGAGARRLDAALLTHDHADQSHGIDDIRAFSLAQRMRIPVHMDAATLRTMTSRFDYVFKGEGGYPPIAEPRPLPAFGAPWTIEGPSGPIPVTTFDQDHGSIRSVGYRFGGVAYSSDVADFPSASFDALRGLDVWIVDALRETPHPTHAHLDRTLEWIARVRPRRAILTNMHIDLDYEALRTRLPQGVEPAYDGMRFQTDL